MMVFSFWIIGNLTAQYTARDSLSVKWKLSERLVLRCSVVNVVSQNGKSSFRKFEIAGHFVKSGGANGYRLHKGKRPRQNWIATNRCLGNLYVRIHNIKHFGWIEQTNSNATRPTTMVFSLWIIGNLTVRTAFQWSGTSFWWQVLFLSSSCQGNLYTKHNLCCTGSLCTG